MLSRKVLIIHLIAEQIKIWINQYFPKAYERSGRNVKVELEISSYATKVDLKGATEVDKFNFQTKSDLASLQAEADKTDTDKINIFLLI